MYNEYRISKNRETSLPNYTIDETAKIAENIRATIEHEKIEHLGRSFGLVTVSMGCAERRADHCLDEKELLNHSDDRLYLSKAKGRNKVTAV